MTECIEDCTPVLTNELVLHYPHFRKPFLLTSDARKVSIRVTRTNGPVESDKPIAYISRTMNDSE